MKHFPDDFYPVYSIPLVVPKDANDLIVVTHRNGKQIGKMIKIPVAELEKQSK